MKHRYTKFVTYLGIVFFAFLASTAPALAQATVPKVDTLTLLRNLYYSDPAVQQILLGLLFVAVLLGVLLAITLLVVLLVVSIFVEPKNFSRHELLQDAWSKVKSNFWFFAVFVLIQIIVINLPGYVLSKIAGSSYADSSLLKNTALILQFALLLYTQAGFVSISLKVADGKKIKISNFFVGGLTYLKYAVAGILHIFISIVGFFLVLVPGVAWYTRFFFWPYSIIDKGDNPIAAFRQSSRLTYHKRKDIFLLIVFLSGINLLGVAALFIGVFVALPLSSVVLARLYRRLADETEAEKSGLQHS